MSPNTTSTIRSIVLTPADNRRLKRLGLFFTGMPRSTVIRRAIENLDNHVLDLDSKEAVAMEKGLCMAHAQQGGRSPNNDG